MNILDTLWILYRTNAKDAVKDQQSLENANKKVKKTAEDATDANDKYAASFDKLAQSAAGFLGAYVGLNVIKSGVKEQIDYNTQLYTTGKLYNQNAGFLKALGQAAKEAGGSSQGALGNIQAVAQQAAARGYANFDASAWLKGVRAYAQKISNPLQRLNYIQNAGVTDSGLAYLVSQGSDKDFDAALAGAAKRAPLSDDDARKAFEANKDIAEASGTLGTYFTKLTDVIKPVIDGFTGLANVLGEKISGNPIAVGGTGLVSVLAGWFGLKTAAKLFTGGGAASGEAAAGAGAAMSPALAATAAGGAGLLGGGIAGYGIVDYFSTGIEHALTRFESRDLIDNTKLAGLRGNGGSLAKAVSGGAPVSDDMAFWMSQGYTKEQAAGIIANMRQESGGNAGAVGDFGQARGLFQWHPDRRANILKNTGIDVTSASYQDQLKAAAWEMKNGRPGFDDNYFRSLGGADAAGAYFSQKFESPANAAMQAVIRGNSALSIASQYSGDLATAGNSSSIKIEKIEVHTQATDAAGIAKDLHQEMLHQLGAVQANFDDGVAR